MLTTPAFFTDSSVGLGTQLINQKKTALLVAMARDLEYDIETFDVDRVYAPRWLVEQERIALADRKSKLPIAERFLQTVELPTAAPPPGGPVPDSDAQLQPVAPASQAVEHRAGAKAAMKTPPRS